MKIADKIKALRAIMRAQKIDAFLIPHGENYNGDYNPAYVEGLRYMFGFSGSLGLGLVTQKAAYLFVDGRYTIQAKQETAGTPIKCGDLSDRAMQEALLKEKTSVLGLDLRIFSENQYRKMQAFCRQADIKISALPKNPIDILWEKHASDRPQTPVSPAHKLPLKHAGLASQNKRKEICRRLKSLGAEASFISAADSIAWLLNIRGDDVAHFPVSLSNGILLANGRFLWFVDSRKTEGLSLPQVEILPPQALQKKLQTLRLKTIHLDSSSASAHVFAACQKAKIAVKEAADLCQLPKACKNKSEVSGARLAHEWDGAAVCEFLRWFETAAPRGSLSELSAAQALWEQRSRHAQCKGKSFETISATAANGAICHYRVSDKSNRRIKKGDIYLVDSGGQYFEGTTDITRTVAVGGKPKDIIKDRFTRVLKGHIALATARFPKGVSGSKLDSLARAPLWQVGLDYAHGTGHGVGSYLNVHEGPQNISPAANSTALRPGMIISNEPGYYKEGAYGIRIENLVLVRDSGEIGEDKLPIYEFETLTLAPIDKSLIKKSLLDAAELQWLNDYHRQVFDRLKAQVSADTARWLSAATSPL